MFYKLEIYDKQHNLINTFESTDNEIVLRQFAQFMSYYWQNKTKYNLCIKSAKVQKLPYVDNQWYGVIEHQSIASESVYSKYVYNFNLED